MPLVELTSKEITKMRNFEKIRTNKQRREYGELVDAGRMRKKTQPRGRSRRRVNWEEI